MFDFFYHIAMTSPQQQGQQGSPWTSMFLMLGMIFIIFYFLILRPQQRQQKEQQKKIESLEKGDKVITIGGIYGMVENVRKDKNIVVLKIADNVKVEFSRSSVATIIKPEDEAKQGAKKS